MLQGGGSRRPAPAAVAGSVAPGETDEPASIVDLPEEDHQANASVRALAQRIASRLSVPKPKREERATRGLGELTSAPYRAASAEIDLDRTVEVLAEHPIPEDEDIIVRERLRTKRSIVLLLDVSGSMRGERIRTAAATVGALAGELAGDDLAVIAFWSDAAVLVDLGEPVRPGELIDALLRIPARGLTNVAFPLEVAASQLSSVPEREARALLLSDCVHNAGPDPRSFAGRLPRLDVLLDATGEKDIELGRELASRGRGLCRLVRDYRDVAPALSAMFAR